MNEIRLGDCRDVMRQLIAEGVKVQTVVTSPPYYGLRDYGIPPSIWGGDLGCAHEWGEGVRLHKGGPHGNGVLLEGGRSVIEAQAACKDINAGVFCQRCGAWRGCLGLEPTYPLYVAHMVEVFALVWDLLAEDGTCWINLGDSYATGAGGVGAHPGGGEQGERWRGGHEGKHGQVGPMTQPNRMPQPRLKPKDRMGMPHRVVFALQDAGWWWRDEIVWKKPNCMPSSQRDRTTCQHEFIFMLARAERYFYDLEAIAEPLSANTHARTPQSMWKTPDGWDTSRGKGGHGSSHREGREKGRKLAAPGSGIKNNGSMDAALVAPGRSGNKARKTGEERGRPGSHIGGSVPWEGYTRTKRSVWDVAVQPYADAHFATFPPELIKPCILAGSRPGDIVFDPFMGSGTTAMVATELGRNYLGCELNPEYAKLAEQRTKVTIGLPLEGACTA